ncbi:MAG: DNA polymerase III subunit delta' [Candidatus Rokubacteria bacterium]|nr:DNA polymerase III subunit delta' [Candidatus Rokubacteria bacterium]
MRRAALAGGPLWQTIVGQEPAVALLQRALATDRVAHAYAFVGPSGVGRRLAALGFAQACLCPRGGCGACSACRRVAAGQHPDCQVLTPTPPRENPRGTPTLRIGEIRELEHWAALTPLEGPRKVFILDEAERLTLQAAEALLKTLEEPPPRTLLILILANVRALPPTVLSRCQLVRFRPLPEASVVALLTARGADPETAALLARLTRGRVGPALDTDLATVRGRRATALELLAVPRPLVAGRLDEAAPDRAEVAAYLETYWLWYRDALCLAAGNDPSLLVNGDREADLAALARRAPLGALADAARAIKEAWLALEANVSPRLCLEQALLAVARGAAQGSEGGKG